MKNLLKGLICIYTVFTLIIIFGTLNGTLSFGHGLGDLYYLIFSVLILIIVLFTFLFRRKKLNENLVLTSFTIILILLTIIILLLKLTFLRGPE